MKNLVYFHENINTSEHRPSDFVSTTSIERKRRQLPNYSINVIWNEENDTRTILVGSNHPGKLLLKIVCWTSRKE